jgi:hypothetical protein
VRHAIPTVNSDIALPLTEGAGKKHIGVILAARINFASRFRRVRDRDCCRAAKAYCCDCSVNFSHHIPPEAFAPEGFCYEQLTERTNFSNA